MPVLGATVPPGWREGEETANATSSAPATEKKSLLQAHHVLLLRPDVHLVPAQVTVVGASSDEARVRVLLVQGAPRERRSPTPAQAPVDPKDKKSKTETLKEPVQVTIMAPDEAAVDAFLSAHSATNVRRAVSLGERVPREEGVPVELVGEPFHDTLPLKTTLEALALKILVRRPSAPGAPQRVLELWVNQVRVYPPGTPGALSRYTSLATAGLSRDSPDLVARLRASDP
jgi:hypothetical protein